MAQLEISFNMVACELAIVQMSNDLSRPVNISSQRKLELLRTSLKQQHLVLILIINFQLQQAAV